MSIHAPAHRLLIIGLDGGTWDILGPLCDLGEMPSLARLRGQGAWSGLLSTQPPFTPPAWSTFLTGVNPGQHGILAFRRKPDPSADGPARSLRGQGTPINASHLTAPTLWDYLNTAGRKVGHINFPLSYPLRPLDGFAISGMLTPPHATDWTYPPELAAELNGYVIDLDYGQPLAPGSASTDPPSPRHMLADIAIMTERQGFHTLRLMGTRPWDALMIVFTGTDRIFHHFWRYLQSDDDRGLETAISDQLVAYFHLLDNIIGSLARAAGRDANIILLSDHGFGSAAHHWAHLNNWLLELGLLHLQTTSPGGWLHQLKHRAPWLHDIAKRILPNEARAALQTHGHLADAIDWPHTLAWAEPLYNNIAGIYLHRADRWPQGAVSPAAAEPLRQRLIDAAPHLLIPGAARPLITTIQRREDIYHGPHTTTFPDLIVTLDPDYAAVPTLGVSLITPVPARGRSEVSSPLPRTGDHRPEGIFLAYGPNVRPGILPHTPFLIDLAPTLLHFAGLPIPDSMEGQVLADVFTDGYLVLHPPRRGPSLPPPPPPADLTSNEAAAIDERLRGLGYL